MQGEDQTVRFMLDMSRDGGREQVRFTDMRPLE